MLHLFRSFPLKDATFSRNRTMKDREGRMSSDLGSEAVIFRNHLGFLKAIFLEILAVFRNISEWVQPIFQNEFRQYFQKYWLFLKAILFSEIGGRKEMLALLCLKAVNSTWNWKVKMWLLTKITCASRRSISTPIKSPDSFTIPASHNLREIQWWSYKGRASNRWVKWMRSP